MSGIEITSQKSHICATLASGKGWWIIPNPRYRCHRENAGGALAFDIAATVDEVERAAIVLADWRIGSLQMFPSETGAEARQKQLFQWLTIFCDISQGTVKGYIQNPVGRGRKFLLAYVSIWRNNTDICVLWLQSRSIWFDRLARNSIYLYTKSKFIYMNININIYIYASVC